MLNQNKSFSTGTLKHHEKAQEGCMLFPASAGNSIHQKRAVHSAEGLCLKATRGYTNKSTGFGIKSPKAYIEEKFKIKGKQKTPHRYRCEAFA
jgi:hypothetical protein